MARLASIFVHPVKSLDAAGVESASVVENGGIEWDRRYAIVDSDGEYVNGKRESQVHRLRATYDLDSWTVALRAADEEATRTFHLEENRDELVAWLSGYFGYDVDLRREDAGGLPDDRDAAGPTVIARGTLEAVASWYDGIDAAEMRRRLRPNLVVAAPPFWEDRLYDEPGSVVPASIGDVDLHGVSPCQRCVVPTRDPDTGEPTTGFRDRFLERRQATLPEWAGEAWFDHYFRLMVNTRVPASSWEETLSAGESVTIGDPIPIDD